MPTPTDIAGNGAPPAPQVGRCSRREQELARLCARTHLTPAAAAHARRLLDEDLDWNALLEWATRHRVLPLLHRRFQESFADDVPAAVLQPLEARAKRTAMRNLFWTKELLRVLERLGEKEIQALPFKGPMLGALVYGDVSMRQFIDLDVLVPQERFTDAKRLLEADGYHTPAAMNDREEAARKRSGKSCELVREGVVIELHWDFLHPMHGFSLDPQEVLARTQSVEMNGRRVPTLAPEDLVLYLCAHGGKHFWSRFFWLCDLAETLHTYASDIHWPTLLQRAEVLNARRMLYLGLVLAHELLDAPVPASVRQRAAGDESVQRLANLAHERLFGEPVNGAADRTFDEARSELQDAQFHLLMRERWRDRLPYYPHLLKLALTPTERDQAFVDLPPTLSSLYYLVRPLRLARDGLGHLGSRVRGDE